MKKLVSVCFPVFENEQSLGELYERTNKVTGQFSDLEFELIFVNDGSKDNSLKELNRIKEVNGDNRLRIINLSRNFGQTAAIIAAWEAAKGDAVINLAADLQDPPEQCIPMINEWLTGKEIVISYRKSHGQTIFNKITSKLFYQLVLPDVPSGGFDVALLSRKALTAFLSLNERNRFYQYDILWIGFDKSYIAYDKVSRVHGKSQFGFSRRFKYFLNAFLYTSYLPLRLMTYLGFGFAISGFIYSLVIVYSYFLYSTPFKGWSPIMILLLIIGGLIMMMLGIVGEYIWRIFEETKNKPLYIVESEN
ncbi:MAG: glycosyltransferase family 2 protein [Bacteroidetes bacterium]|nr:glycosyltransferase family 2 protein [Bacteroidota bacterium]